MKGRKLTNKAIKCLSIVATICLLLMLASCASGNLSSTEKSSASSTNSPSQWEYTGMDAEQILNALKSKGAHVGQTVVYDEKTDPNGKLGTEGNYSSKATFTDDRLDAKEAKKGSDLSRDFGGTIEVFNNEQDCITREETVTNTVDRVGGVGDMYVYRYENVLLRIGCKLDQDQANEYLKAFVANGDEANCSKKGMAADNYIPLEKTGETTELYGVVFSTGEGWSIGNPVDADGFKTVYIEKGTDISQRCYIGRINEEPYSTEIVEKAMETIIASTGRGSAITTVDIDGITAWRASAKSDKPEVIWSYTLIPMNASIVVLCYYVTDDAPENAIPSFEKTIHLNAEGLESATAAVTKMAAGDAASNRQPASASAPAPASEPNQTSSSNDSSTVSPDLKDALDSYESFVDEYVEFMERYKNSGNSAELVKDYYDFMQKYADLSGKIDAIDENNLSAADYAYYTEVMTRISQKLMSVSM